ncbi:hypothetical protein ACRAWF_06035 [Streptomyces sp. L7]
MGARSSPGGCGCPARPGGIFHLRGGLVIAVEVPARPARGAAAALRPDQRRAMGRAGTGVGRLALAGGGGLIAHGYAGAAQLRIVCVLALHDAAFAVVAGETSTTANAPRTQGRWRP